MHGVKEVFGAASSTALLYACATPHTLATFVPSLHLSFTLCFLRAIPSPSSVILSPFQENQQFRDARSSKFPSPTHNPVPQGARVPASRISYWVIVSFRCGTSQRSHQFKACWARSFYPLRLGCPALFLSLPGDHPVEPELMQSIVCLPNSCGFIGSGVGTVRLACLQEPHQENSAVVQRLLQRHLFAGLLGPFQFALLHKKVLRAVPTGYFYRVQTCSRNLGLSSHPWPLKLGTAGQEPLAAPLNSLKMRRLCTRESRGIVRRGDTLLRSVQKRGTRRFEAGAARSQNCLSGQKCNKTRASPPAVPPSRNCSRAASPGSVEPSFRS